MWVKSFAIPWIFIASLLLCDALASGQPLSTASGEIVSISTTGESFVLRNRIAGGFVERTFYVNRGTEVFNRGLAVGRTVEVSFSRQGERSVVSTVERDGMTNRVTSTFDANQPRGQNQQLAQIPALTQNRQGQNQSLVDCNR